MLNVSESACVLLSEMLNEAQAPDGMAARIVPTEGGLSLTMDNVQNDDETYHHGGKPVLVVSHSVGELIDNRTLDVANTPQGPQLTLEPVGGEA